MEDITLQKFREITNIKQFIEYIRVYYPGLSFEEYTIGNIENALNETYIKLIGRIMYYSPKNMRIFLTNFLMKYEIRNIKNVILSTILRMSVKEKKKLVNYLVEKYLSNTEFINELAELNDLDEIQLFMKGTKYNRAVREGLLYFKKENEVFVLEAFLDRVYYVHLNNELKLLNNKERVMISLYVKFVTEIYNLNLIYRGIKNKIDKKLLSQFIVKNFLFLDGSKLEHLLSLTELEDFISVLNYYLSNNVKIKKYFISLTFNKKHLIWSIEKIYLNYYFKIFTEKIDDIEHQTIYRILEVIIKKDNEIRHHILPKVVSILHEKIRALKPKFKKKE